MKKKIRMYFRIISCIILLASCKGGDKKIAIKHQIKLNNELKNANFFDFIRETKYIQLETSDEVLISEVTKLYVSKERIYILDQRKLMGLFVFDLKGKFLFKIMRVGGGPGEYHIISDFIINEKDKTIRLLADGGRLINYDFTGRFIEEEKVPLLYASFIFPLTENKYVMANYSSVNEKSLVYFLDEKFKIESASIETPSGWERIKRRMEVSYSGYHMNYLFSFICSTKIYEINQNGVSAKYDFEVPLRDLLTDNIINETRSLDERNFNMKTFQYFTFESFFDLKHKLFAVFSIKEKRYWSIYDQNNNDFKYVAEDKLICSKEIDFVAPTFLSQIDQNTLAGIICSDSILKNETIKTFNKMTISKESNPIVVICKMKI